MTETKIPTDVAPDVAAMLEKVATLGLTKIQDMSPVAARQQMEAMVRARDVPPVKVARVENRTIAGPSGEIPIRLYWPEGARDAPLPILVYFHGGGHVIGSLDTHDAPARSLCAGGHCIVVSVDYRMGPEHRYPAAVEDSWAATLWAAGHAGEIGGDATRLAVGGDSAGGNLAAVVSLMARDAGGPSIVYQLLIYPLVDYRRAAGGYASYKTYAVGYGMLEGATMDWFAEHYLRSDADAEDWRVSPILARDFTRLPPAMVLAAECDVLVDEGVAYTEKLRAAGVEVEYVSFAGQIHAFFPLAGIIAGADAANEKAGKALKAALHG